MNVKTLQVVNDLYEQVKNLCDNNQTAIMGNMKIWKNENKYYICKENENSAFEENGYDNLIDALIHLLEECTTINYTVFKKIKARMWSLFQNSIFGQGTNKVSLDDILVGMKNKKQQLSLREQLGQN